MYGDMSSAGSGTRYKRVKKGKVVVLRAVGLRALYLAAKKRVAMVAGPANQAHISKKRHAHETLADFKARRKACNARRSARQG